MLIEGSSGRSVLARKRKSLRPPTPPVAECQCASNSHYRRGKVTVTLTLATVLVLGIPPVTASPTFLSPRQQEKQRYIDHSDFDHPASSPFSSSSSSSPDASSSSFQHNLNSKRLAAKIYGTAAQEQLRDSVQTIPDSSSSSSSSDSSSNNNLNIPDGWVPVKRATGFYHVPVIISLSVILSTLLAVLIVGSVFWRKQRRTKKKHAVGPYDKAEKGVLNKGLLTEGNGLSRIVHKIRRTKRGKRGVGGQAVHSDSRGGGTGSSERLGLSTARRSGSARSRRSAATVASVSRPSSSLTPVSTVETPTVEVSQSQSRSSSPSSTPSLHAVQRTLSRASVLSRTSSHSIPYLPAPPDSNLGQPNDDSPHSVIPPDNSPAGSSTSQFGSYFPVDVVLPNPGPPAYRPNSSTVRRTTRLTESVLPLPSSSRHSLGADRVNNGTSRASTSNREEEDRDEWHWPNEKRVIASTSTQSTFNHATSSRLSTHSLPDPEEAEDEGEVDRSAFVAHIATDDKATLARLRQLASSPLPRRNIGELASAPSHEEESGLESEEVEDEEDRKSDTKSTLMVATTSSFLLPPPSRPLNYSSPNSSSLPVTTLSSKEKEVAANALPTYVHGGEGREQGDGDGARMIREMASAPPPPAVEMEDREAVDGQSDEEDLYT